MGLRGKCAVVVAHPDDETIWAGGTILANREAGSTLRPFDAAQGGELAEPQAQGGERGRTTSSPPFDKLRVVSPVEPQAQWKVVTLCRRSDPDRAPKFARVMEQLGAQGVMGDLDDGPDQEEVEGALVEKTIMELLGDGEYEAVLSHSPEGEYTRHRRHEETGRAVIGLWKKGVLRTKELWLFAYEDGQGRYTPKAIEKADRVVELERGIWLEKRRLIRDTYGFGEKSFEVRSAGRREAFWTFGKAEEAERRFTERGTRL